MKIAQKEIKMLNKFKNIFIRTKIGNFNANAKRLYPEEFEDLCNILPELIHNSPLAQFYFTGTYQIILLIFHYVNIVLKNVVGMLIMQNIVITVQ